MSAFTLELECGFLDLFFQSLAGLGNNLLMRKELLSLVLGEEGEEESSCLFPRLGAYPNCANSSSEY